MQNHIVADAAIAADNDSCAEVAPRSHDRSFTENDKGADGRVRANLRRRMNDGLGRDARNGSDRFATKQAHQQDKRGERVGDFDKGKRRFGRCIVSFAVPVGGMFPQERCRHEECGRLTGFQVASESFAFDERDVTGAGFAQRSGVADYDRTVAVNLSLNQRRQLLDGNHH
jgi:hypothetical protein